MSKIQESLETISQTENRTDRLTLLAGLISTLLSIKGVRVAVTGVFAYECYVRAPDSESDLEIGIYSGNITPRIVQSVFAEDLGAIGQVWDWYIADIRVRIRGNILTSHRELCREYTSEFGQFKMLPIEELVAERVVASSYPIENEQARSEAKHLLMLGLSETISIDWILLQEICSSEGYFTGDLLGTLRAEAKLELDSYMESTTGDQGEKETATEVAESQETSPLEGSASKGEGGTDMVPEKQAIDPQPLAQAKTQSAALNLPSSQLPSPPPLPIPENTPVVAAKEVRITRETVKVLPDKEASKRMTTKMPRILPLPTQK